MTNSLTDTLKLVTRLVEVLEAAGVTDDDLQHAIATQSVHHRMARELVTNRIGLPEVGNTLERDYADRFLMFVFGGEKFRTSTGIRRLRTPAAVRDLVSGLNELARTIVVYFFSLNDRRPLTVHQLSNLLGIRPEEVEALRNAAVRTIRRSYEATQ